MILSGTGGTFGIASESGFSFFLGSVLGASFASEVERPFDFRILSTFWKVFS